jgi:hypothetical protein
MKYEEAESFKEKLGKNYIYENELYEVVIVPKNKKDFNDFLKYYRLDKNVNPKKYSSNNEFDIYALIIKRGIVLGKSISNQD